MKLKFKATVALLLVLSMMIPMSVSVFAESNSDDDLIWQSMTEKTSAVFENADEMALENVKEVYDFAGNIFKVLCTQNCRHHSRKVGKLRMEREK